MCFCFLPGMLAFLLGTRLVPSLANCWGGNAKLTVNKKLCVTKWSETEVCPKMHLKPELYQQIVKIGNATFRVTIMWYSEYKRKTSHWSSDVSFCRITVLSLCTQEVMNQKFAVNTNCILENFDESWIKAASLSLFQPSVSSSSKPAAIQLG